MRRGCAPDVAAQRKRNQGTYVSRLPGMSSAKSYGCVLFRHWIAGLAFVGVFALLRTSIAQAVR